MTNLKIVAMRCVNAVVVLGTFFLIVAGAASDANSPGDVLIIGAVFAGLYVTCAAINYVLFGKATIWNKLEVESS